MFKIKAFVGGGLVGAAIFVGVPASAASFTGEFWDAPANTFATIDNAVAFANGAGAPTATFTSTGIAYGDGPGFGIGSLSDFLNADAGSIVGTDPSSIQESVFRITGLAGFTSGANVSVTSDDGFILTVDGTEISRFDGLRGPNNTTTVAFAGATGVYDFTLWYFEGNPTQAQLEANIAPIPLPAGAALLTSALIGLGAFARKSRKAA